MNGPDGANLRVVIVAAHGLYKSDIFNLPHPFAILTVNGEQESHTGAIEKTLTPYWNETFEVTATRFSVLTVRVFDHKKFEKKGMGFLGVVNIPVGSVLDLDLRENKVVEENLQISRGGELVSHGKLVVQLSWIFQIPPINNQQPSQTAKNSKRFVRAMVSVAGVVASRQLHKRQLRESVDRSLNEPGDESPISRPSSCAEQQPHPHVTSEDAVAAWRCKFGNPHIQLEQQDPAPFSTIRRLGGGGIGIVYETQLSGIALALKKTYTRGLTDEHLNEIKILSRISAKRHKHIVGLIGSYVHRQRGSYELGLLIWPVAHCDLAIYLQDIDTLGRWVTGKAKDATIAEKNDLRLTACENLHVMADSCSLENSGSIVEDEGRLQLLERSLEILHSKFGCIASAVAWLHQEGIRHKDLKPSQILLSPDGLWLTDFGWSRDISELAQSTTSEGDNITLKYQSPERAQKKPCGRPEDIFALGCIFLEMAYQLAKIMLRADEQSAPWHQKGWYFQAHIGQLSRTLGEIKQALYELGHGFRLAKLIAEMLAVNPEVRPIIEQVVDRLMLGGYTDVCCAPELQRGTNHSRNHQQLQNSAGKSGSQDYPTPPVPPAYPRLPVHPSMTASYDEHLQSEITAQPISSCAEPFQPSILAVESATRDIAGHNQANSTVHIFAPTPIHHLPVFNNNNPPPSTDITAPHYFPTPHFAPPGPSSVYGSSYQTTPPFPQQSQPHLPTTQNLINSSMSSLNIADQTTPPPPPPPPAFPAPPQNPQYPTPLPRARTFSTPPTTIVTTPGRSNRKIFRQVSSALSGLDRQISGLINDDKTGR